MRAAWVRGPGPYDPPMDEEWPIAELFDEDYLHFYAWPTTRATARRRRCGAAVTPAATVRW